MGISNRAVVFGGLVAVAAYGALIYNIGKSTGELQAIRKRLDDAEKQTSGGKDGLESITKDIEISRTEKIKRMEEDEEKANERDQYKLKVESVGVGIFRISPGKIAATKIDFIVIRPKEVIGQSAEISVGLKGGPDLDAMLLYERKPEGHSFEVVEKKEFISFGVGSFNVKRTVPGTYTYKIGFITKDKQTGIIDQEIPVTYTGNIVDPAPIITTFLPCEDRKFVYTVGDEGDNAGLEKVVLEKNGKEIYSDKLNGIMTYYSNLVKWEDWFSETEKASYTLTVTDKTGNKTSETIVLDPGEE